MHLCSDFACCSVMAMLQLGDCFIPVLRLLLSAKKGKYVPACHSEEKWNIKFTVVSETTLGFKVLEEKKKVLGKY